MEQDATLSQGVPRDAAVNFGATGYLLSVLPIFKKNRWIDTSLQETPRPKSASGDVHGGTK